MERTLMNVLVSLRQLKGKALDQMQALNALTKKDNRDLTDSEALDYRLKKSLAEDLNSAIALGELELEVLESASAPVAPASAPAPRPNLAARVMAWKIR